MGDDENACIRNIVKEIMRESGSRKIKVNKNFVTYLTKLLLTNPSWGIGDDFFNQRQNVQQFVGYVIDELLSKQDDPKVVTMKIQFYFSCNLEHMEYIIDVTRKDLRNKLALLKDDICATNNLETKDDVDLLYKKIVNYVTLISGLGNPSKPKVYEEALFALKSILDEQELNEFICIPKHEKAAQLMQYNKLVAGIRLFNKDCERGGEGIDNLPDLINKATDVIRTGTQESLLLIMERVNGLTTAVDKSYVIRQTYKGYQMHLELLEEISKSNIGIDYLKDMLIFFRQYELLIRKVLEEVDRIHEKGEYTFLMMDQMLKTIHDTVFMKIAIPVGIIFPLFEQLWEIWEHFQDQALFLSRLSVIMTNLETYSKQTYFDHPSIDHVIGDIMPMTDAERLAETAHIKLESTNPNVSVIRSDTIKNIDDIKLEYLGFCCWKLIETDGALIPGNPSMGIVVYKGKHYVFSCEEGFSRFVNDPDIHISFVLDLARRKPQLIHFFQLTNDLEKVYNIKKLVRSQIEITMCEDKQVQTISHIEEPHIKPEYKWNIWDLKKDALNMANILKTVTVSCQTDKTSSNNSVRTQTYNTKQAEIQTSRDTHSNTPKASVFLYGLRGRKDDQQFQIDFSQPLDKR